MTTHRARSPQAPLASPAQQREELEQAQRLAEREVVERRRQLRGLLLLVLAVMMFSIWRASVGRVFTHGWWRLW